MLVSRKEVSPCDCCSSHKIYRVQRVFDPNVSVAAPPEIGSRIRIYIDVSQNFVVFVPISS